MAMVNQAQVVKIGFTLYDIQPDFLSQAQLYIVKDNLWLEVEIGDLRMHNVTWLLRTNLVPL